MYDQVPHSGLMEREGIVMGGVDENARAQRKLLDALDRERAAAAKKRQADDELDAARQEREQTEEDLFPKSP